MRRRTVLDSGFEWGPCGGGNGLYLALRWRLDEGILGIKLGLLLCECALGLVSIERNKPIEAGSSAHGIHRIFMNAFLEKLIL